METNRKLIALEEKIDKLQSTLDWMIKGMKGAQGLKFPHPEKKSKVKYSGEIDNLINPLTHE